MKQGGACWGLGRTGAPLRKASRPQAEEKPELSRHGPGRVRARAVSCPICDVRGGRSGLQLPFPVHTTPGRTSAPSVATAPPRGVAPRQRQEWLFPWKEVSPGPARALGLAERRPFPSPRQRKPQTLRGGIPTTPLFPASGDPPCSVICAGGRCTLCQLCTCAFSPCQDLCPHSGQH